MVKKIPRYVCSFWHDPRTWQTGGQTDRRKNRQTPHNSIDRACIASRGKNASQHVGLPVYLQQFPSYSNQNCKNRHFYVPRPSFFVCPRNAPVAITQNVAWLKRQFSACQTPRSMYPSIFNSFPVIQTASAKNRVFTYRSPYFCFLWRRPCDYDAKCCIDGKTIQCLPNASQHVPIYLQQFPSYTMLKSMRSPKIAIFTTFLFPLGTPLGQSG